MKTNFDTVCIGNVAKVRSGYAFKGKDWIDSGVPVVKIANVKDGELVMENCSFVSQTVADEAKEWLLHEGDILIAMTGYVGDVARVRGNTPRLLNQRVGRFEIVANGACDSDFLYYTLRCSEIKHSIKGLGYGSAQPNISPRLIHSVEIPLPPPDEQRAIAGVLGALDDKIEQNRRTAQIIERLARAIFRAWFVDFEPVKAKAAGATSFPSMPQSVFDALPTCFVNSDIGPVPERWEVKTLGEVAVEVRDAVKPEQIDSNTPYIGLEHMPKKCIALSEWEPVSKVSSNKARFSAGQILFGKLRPYYHKVGIAPVDGVCSTDIVVVDPQKPFYFGIILGLVSSDAFVAHTNACSSGTKMPRTKWADMEKFPLAIPPSSVAKAFDVSMRSMAEKIVADIHQSRKLAEMRDYLLPKLLSGEVRLQISEKALDRVG